MDTGQISLMPANVGIPMPGGAQLSSLTTLLSEPEGQAGGPFAGLLKGMVPPQTPQGTAAPISVGKGVAVSDKSGVTASTTAVQDGVSGLMAGLLNALDAAGKPLATGTEQSAEVPAKADRSDRSDRKPQDVVLNADGLPMALLTQVNGGRMPQADGAVEQQTDHGTDTALKSATEGSAEVPARAGTLDKKPQDVAMNAVGMQPPPMLTQINGGRMPQADGAVEQQTVHGAEKPLQSATEGSAEVPARADTLDKKPQDVAMSAVGMQPPPLLTRVDGGRMPQADGTVMQQTVVASMADTPVTSFSNKGGVSSIVASPSTDAGGGLNPPENLLGLNQPAMVMVEHGPLKGDSTGTTALEVVPQGSEPQYVAQKEPDRTTPPALSSRQVSAVVEQQNLAVVNKTASTERGMASNNQNGRINTTVAPVSGTPGPDTGGAEVRATAPTGGEVTAQPQQAVTLFRSASLEVALAESVPQNEVRTTGQTPIGSSAQNAPVAEIPAASTAMTAQTGPPQDVSFANSGVIPVPVAPLPASAQQPDQAVTANNDTIDGTRPVQAAVVPAAGKMGVEAGKDAAQTRPESATTAKSVQSTTVEAVKFAGAGSSGEEFNTGDDKGTTDNFMNGQFHAALMNQQGNVEGSSVANNVSAPVKNEAQQSGLSEQILLQVKDSLVNHEVKTGNNQIVLRLSPENLGELKVNLSMDGQNLKVEIVAENHMVRDALLQNTDSLKESLARQNISMQSFSVTTGNPGQRQQQGDWRESGRQQQNTWMTSTGYQTSDTAVKAAQLAYQTASAHTMVDLHF
ncbi:MAG: flagellar hook-length control protein FliK [Oryzomonas sp.]|uniref:flagellar hook-length control protein FliK n=1 Tax=Oryzomonas sp. TaxID=2855186 RepID=UPI002840156A|nr:flagellar hook-length control protein FliK [Oryzomonas sp.]MDR3579077.1 flagellar hook-length control protein FliK [Oryzomonas sp.]